MQSQVILQISGLSLIQSTKDNFAGLWYSTAVAGIYFVVGAFLIKETRNVELSDLSDDGTAG